MSGARVAKLEALLARIQQRRTEPRLQLVDATAGGPAAIKSSTRRTLPPSLLMLDDPSQPVAASASIAPPAPSTRPPFDRSLQTDDPAERKSVQLAPAADPAAAFAELGEDELATSVGRPAVDLGSLGVGTPAPDPAGDELATSVRRPAVDLGSLGVGTPASDLAGDEFATSVAIPAVDLRSLGVQPPMGAAPAVPAPPPVVEPSRPVLMQVPPLVASGPIATFVGHPESRALSFGQLVGLAMSLTTR